MQPGAFVRIHTGPFSGMTGNVLRVLGEFFVIRLTASGIERIFRSDELQAEQRSSERH